MVPQPLATSIFRTRALGDLWPPLAVKTGKILTVRWESTWEDLSGTDERKSATFLIDTDGSESRGVPMCNGWGVVAVGQCYKVLL